jgi:hypothetical protein
MSNQAGASSGCAAQRWAPGEGGRYERAALLGRQQPTVAEVTARERAA